MGKGRSDEDPATLHSGPHGSGEGRRRASALCSTPFVCDWGRPHPTAVSTGRTLRRIAPTALFPYLIPVQPCSHRDPHRVLVASTDLSFRAWAWLNLSTFRRF